MRLFCVLPTLVMLIIGPGCAAKSQIITAPEGVTVYLDGKQVGTTPCEIRTGRGLPKNHLIRLEKPGFKTVSHQLATSFHADVSLVWILALIVPYYFTARLEDEYRWELEPAIPEGLEPDTGTPGEELDPELGPGE